MGNRDRPEVRTLGIAVRVLVAPVAVAMMTPMPAVAVPPAADAVPAPATASPLPLPAITAASGAWEYEAPQVAVAPPPVSVPRDYGPVPELTGPILLTAEKYIGTPYVWGGESPAGFDCSGFVQHVYAENGVALPRTVDGLHNVGTVTTTPQPGDLVLTSSHVALYVAPGWQIDSPRPGKTVQIRPIWQKNPIYVHID